MFDVDKVATQIDDEADKNAIIILGASIKEEMQDEISVTVIAAGFEKTNSDLLNSPVIPSAGAVDADSEMRSAQGRKNHGLRRTMFIKGRHELISRLSYRDRRKVERMFQ